MNIYQLTEIQILTFALVMLRITGFVFSAAIIGSGSVPVPVRVLLSLILTITVWPTLNITSAVISGFGESLIYLSLTEVLLGLLIGYLTRIFFLTVEMAGEIASSSMGLSAAQIFNPSLQANTSSIGQFYNILATLLFFSILGHHIMIAALAESFRIAPVGKIGFSVGPFAEFAVIGQQLLVIAVKLAAPVLISVLLANIAMGILGKTIPQLNVLITSFPVTVMLGLFVMIVALPIFIGEMGQLANNLAATLMMAMKAI